ncbi:MAG: TIGR04283 family arsenosugar biosynthesis glycosyltransferase [Thermodesulfobacteriota bacterium]
MTLSGSNTDVPRFSIVIPVYQEQETIKPWLERLSSLKAPGGLEIIVVDGGPGQETILEIKTPSVSKLSAAKGRARQMNAGAQAARGEILLFLHADTILPDRAFLLVDQAMKNRTIVGGAFDLRIESRRPLVRFIGRAATLRSRLTRAPYGDQVIFLRRDFFRLLEGYADIPLMEDLELMRRIKRRRGRIAFISEPVKTSGRRWEREGPWRCTGRNIFIRLLYHLGVSPDKLVGFYPS